MDKPYFECGLPPFLQDSLCEYKKNKDNEMRWDCYYCELQSSINVAEVEQLISSEQAWYLREKYLGLVKEA